MVFFNYALRKLNAKIVYYGPGLCGKTTNLQWIHDHFEGGQRGKMISLATEGDRTIFFDLLPIDIGSIRGMDVTLQLYTVPGQVHYNSTRQLVLRGADGVVFVADSQRTMRSSNVESFENLQENLMLQGIDLKDFPHVLQFNKRDLRDLLSIEDLNESLNVFSTPIFEGIATEGIGVQETLEGIVKLVMRNLREKYEPVASASGPKAPKPMKPMKVAGPAPVTTAPTLMPMPVGRPEPRPEAPAAKPPAAAEPAAPPAAEAVGSFDEPTPVGEPPSEDVGDIDFGADFPSFQDEDQINTRVYESDDEPEEVGAASDAPWDEDEAEAEKGSGAAWSEELEIEDEELEPAFAVDREALAEDEAELEEDEVAALFTDPRDEDGSIPDELPPPKTFIPPPPEKRPDLDTDPSFMARPEPPISESMDDIFAPDADDAAAGERGFATEREPVLPASAAFTSVSAPEESDRYVDRIEAPGPFAPPPTRPAPPPPAASDQSEVDFEVLRALGAAEDREALASLGLERDDLLAEPPEVEPVIPPPEPPEVMPVDPRTFEGGPTDTIAIGSVYAEAGEPDEPAFETSEPPAEEEPPTFVEPEPPADVAPPAFAAPPVAEPEPVRPQPPPVAPPPASVADRHDRMAKSQPIMVGHGEPFTRDEPAPAAPEVVRASASVVPASSRSFDFTTEGNQLHLALRGSGAIAEMGQVRALDIEVPVPGHWVGNRKVTLQLRLTLTPAEEENG